MADSYQAHSIHGVFTLSPTKFGDDRGSFREWYKASSLTAVRGFPLQLAQANCSVSAAGVVRGLHLAEVPPGQAKVVTCPAGRVTDIVVDLRVGSPTYLEAAFFELSGDNGQVVVVPNGCGHGFIAHEDNSVVMYMVDQEYNPAKEFGVDIFDAELGLAPRIQELLDGRGPIQSDKDATAPGLHEVRSRLPQWESYLQWNQAAMKLWENQSGAGVFNGYTGDFDGEYDAGYSMGEFGGEFFLPGRFD